MNSQIEITNNQKNTNNQTQNFKKYDLEERTFEFGKRILKLCQSLPQNAINYRLSDQLLRSGTSVGANYREANESGTSKDFQNKVRICKKEAKETHYWLQIIIEANPEFKTKISLLLIESIELVKIFASILEKSKRF